MAVSSPVSTSFSSSMTSSSPFIRSALRSRQLRLSHRSVGGPTGTFAVLGETVLRQDLLHRRPAAPASRPRPTALGDLVESTGAVFDGRPNRAVVDCSTAAD